MVNSPNIIAETEKTVETPASTVTTSTQVVPPKTSNSSNTAILGGGLIGLPGLHTVMLAIVAFFGVGNMPDAIALQEAIVNVGYAVIGAAFIYLTPGNRPVNNVIVKTNTVENKVE